MLSLHSVSRGGQERTKANVSVISNTKNVKEVFSSFTGNETGRSLIRR